jgi:anaerobic carbon-monoxide dehydrogenase iron sulfur subunit
VSRQLRIIPDKCTGCIQCELACSWVQTGTFQPARSLIRVHLFDDHASYAPYTCFQCDEAWCMTACPVNAINIAATAAKVVVPDLCVGCGLCTIACPFGTVFYNPDTHKAVKCDLCAGDPACVRACPTGAIEYVETRPADWLGPWAVQLNERQTAMRT